MSSVMYDANDGDDGDDSAKEKIENELEIALQGVQEELTELRRTINVLHKRLEPVTKGAITVDSIEAREINGSFTPPSPLRQMVMSARTDVMNLRQKILTMTKKLDI